MDMIDQYRKGVRAERELIDLLWSKGFAVVRSAGSGVSKRPCPDLIAGNAERKIAFMCKNWNSNIIYFEHEEIMQLIEFSKTFGCESYIAIRQDGWHFFDVNALEATRKGNFKLDVNKKYLAKDLGELLGEYKQKRL